MDPTMLLTLENMLTFLTAGGAAYLAFYILDNRNWPLNAEQKRYAAYGLTAGLAIVFWFMKVVLVNEPLPADWRELVQVAYSVGAGAVIGNQLIHARLSMKKE
jgi:hypothetical protein